ncbi:MAG: TIM barrel protein [Clostridia bacterium]|nr:TIM barrel protein [Clostridia bacterium]
MDAKNWIWGMSSCCVGSIDRTAFEAYAQAGVGCMEVSLSYAAYANADFKAAATASRETGVPVWSLHLPFYPFRYLDPSSLDKEVRDNTLVVHKHGVDQAALLDAKVVVVHPSGEPNADETRAAQMQYAAEHLCKLADYAAQYGIKVAVEDLPRTCLGNCSAEIKQLIAGHENLGVCFDTNHLLTEKNSDFIRALGDKIITLHVSDYDFMNERHWLPYEGKVNWVELVTLLEQAGYTGPFMYELGLLTPDSIFRDRDLTFADFRANYQACVNKQPFAPVGTPNIEVCNANAFLNPPIIQ